MGVMPGHVTAGFTLLLCCLDPIIQKSSLCTLSPARLNLDLSREVSAVSLP